MNDNARGSSDLKPGSFMNHQQLERVLQDMHIMEPDEIRKAVDYRKRKEAEEIEGRQIHNQASMCIRNKICTIIFCLIIIILIVVGCYTHIKVWQNH